MLSQYTHNPSVLARFWKKVAVGDGCWLWQGGTDQRGYGVFWLEGTRPQKFTKAHRFSFALHYGEFPEELEICHNCPGGDNPTCVNPAHLFPGTRQENHADMWSKGRGFTIPKDLAPHGSRNGHAKVDEGQVACLRTRYALGVSCAELSADYGIRPSTIYEILRRKKWTHVPPADPDEDTEIAARLTAGKESVMFHNGTAHPLSKLNPERVREIRARHAAGESLYALAPIFGMSETGLSDVVHRRTWRHVE